MKQSLRTRFRKWLGELGPGVVTGASDDDPSGILTYLQAGVMLGFQTLWTALVTLPLMYGVQEMCARIGLMANRGLMRIVKDRYPRGVVYPLAALSAFVITVNIGADLLAIGAVLEKLFQISRFFWIPTVAFTIVICTVFFSYHRFANTLKWLIVSLIFYVATVFFLNIDWRSAIRATIIPSFVWSKENILLITAILGTTISPYLFFWQANEEVEEERATMKKKSLKRFIVTKHELKLLKEDTFIGMLFSNIVTWFTIVAGAGIAANYGIHAITDFDHAALVLQPVLGPFAYLMFALGIIGTGLLAIPVLAGSVGYILSEVFGWEEGMNKRFNEARGFYAAIAFATLSGMALTLIGFDPIQLLIYTAVLYAVITPPLIYIIVQLGNDATLMKHRVNGTFSNTLGILALLLMTGAAIAYILSVI